MAHKQPASHAHAEEARQGQHGHSHAHPHQGVAPGTGAEHGHTHGEGEQDHGPEGIVGLVLSVVRPHTHAFGGNVDAAMQASGRGIRAVKLSLVGLAVTAVFQLVIVLASGSVALLADTVHNFSDALTAIPLWIAFALARRAADRQYTYGYGRVEDLAGIFVLLMIAASAAVAGWESFDRFLHPKPLAHLGWVMAAGVIGFAGNEAVALFRIRMGKTIGSAALVADGYHARTDGLTSLAVALGALGVMFGFNLADPVIGLLISIAILFVLRDAVRQMWPRLVDAAEPGLVDRLEHVAAHVKGVQRVGQLRVRWLGHRMEADLRVEVDEDMSTRDSHQVAEAVRHALVRAEPKLGNIVVHVDPCGHSGADHHSLAGHHVTP